MNKQEKKKEQHWMKRWGTEVRRTRVPNVFQMKKGGHFVRARVTDPTTGKLREIKKSLPEADEATAFKWLSDERERIRKGTPLVLQQQTRFAEYAASLLERKIAKRKIRSARGRERWRYTLEHLLCGTKGVTGFGEMFVQQIKPSHIEEWQVGIAKLITAKVYSPTTANGWLNILKNIMTTAKRELGLATNPTEGVEAFDSSEHSTYSDEEPNALTADETKEFLACMWKDFPQHYAMTFLGFATGLRPSSLRPLRRNGPTPDVLFKEGAILVRRSHTLGNEVMETTKTGLRQRITVPAELIAILEWHCRTQLITPEQLGSELLFPREDGGFRTESCLKKAFAHVGGLIGLKKKFTPRGMRRTYNDLMRIAKVENLVIKSISGHLTDRMKDHYSTVSPVEQRESIRSVLRLVHFVPSPAAAPTATSASGATGGANDIASGATSEALTG